MVLEQIIKMISVVPLSFLIEERSTSWNIEILQVPTSGDIDSLTSKCLWSSERDAGMILVVSVGLPDGGTFNVMDHFMVTLQPILFVYLCIGCSVLPLNPATHSQKTSVAEVGADLQTCQLAVNLGACAFNGSAVRMLNFADIATEDHGVSVS